MIHYRFLWVYIKILHIPKDSKYMFRDSLKLLEIWPYCQLCMFTRFAYARCTCLGAIRRVQLPSALGVRFLERVLERVPTKNKKSWTVPHVCMHCDVCFDMGACWFKYMLSCDSSACWFKCMLSCDARFLAQHRVPIVCCDFSTVYNWRTPGQGC